MICRYYLFAKMNKDLHLDMNTQTIIWKIILIWIALYYTLKKNIVYWRNGKISNKNKESNSIKCEDNLVYVRGIYKSSQQLNKKKEKNKHPLESE